MSAKTLCFSGHRPEKLPHKGDESSVAIGNLKSLLYKEIYDSITEGYTDFITGLSRGIDIWAANMVIEFKNKMPNLRLICARPYKGFGDERVGYEKWELCHILEKADEIVDISPFYTDSCMKKRNFYMVDRSSKLIAVVRDYYSGTGQTIRYAVKKGLCVKIIDISKNVELFR